MRKNRHQPIQRRQASTRQDPKELVRLCRRIRALAKDLERVLDIPFEHFLDIHLNYPEGLWDEQFYSFELGKILTGAKVAGIAVERLTSGVVGTRTRRAESLASTAGAGARGD